MGSFTGSNGATIKLSAWGHDIDEVFVGNDELNLICSTYTSLSGYAFGGRPEAETLSELITLLPRLHAAAYKPGATAEDIRQVFESVQRKAEEKK